MVDGIARHGDDFMERYAKSGDEFVEEFLEKSDAVFEGETQGGTQLRNGYEFGRLSINFDEIQTKALQAAGDKSEAVAKLDSSSQDGNKWFAECHGSDSSPTSGSNAQTGWVYRISVKNNGSGKAFYLATDGKFYSEKMFNINGIYYVESIINDTHIPIN